MALGVLVPNTSLTPASTHPSLDFSYQERPESSGSELEEVMVLQPPSSKGRAR